MKADSLNDFPDRLSPMLVKELRQGMRTRSFIGVFLALQIILAVILLAASAGASSDQAGSTISAIIFIFFSIAVLVVQPMRGIASLSSEIKGNTIDMMVLTRLSAWRIVSGKWFAIVSQSALMLTTIIPYLILRYFFGGMNLLGEVVLLALIFITSAALTAITVGLSASGSVILRSILPMIGLPVGSLILLQIMMFRAFSGGGAVTDFFALDTPESRISIAIYVAACAYYGFFLLAMGTALIAPYAENHSTLRRLVALGVTAVATALCVFHVTDLDVLPVVFTLIFLPVFAISLTEFGNLVPPVYRKFSRFGALGKLTAPFLFPGWASGLFFTCVLILVASLAYLAVSSPYSGADDHVIVSFGLLGTLMFPALIINLFRMKGPSRVTNYLLLLVASAIISMVLLGVAESLSNPGFLWLFVWIPPVALSMLETRADDDAVFAAIVIVDMLIFAALFIMALRAYLASISEVRQSISSTE